MRMFVILPSSGKWCFGGGKASYCLTEGKEQATLSNFFFVTWAYFFIFFEMGDGKVGMEQYLFLNLDGFWA
jgi:hypothetical protein